MENLVSVSTGNRVAITGGAGFIGRNLCSRLLDAGATVLALDDFRTSTEDGLARLRARPGFEFLRHDVTEPLPQLDAGTLFHLACPASPVHYMRDPIGTLMTAVRGTYNVLVAAERCRARVVVASTSEIYGDPEVHPQPERYFGRVNVAGPRSCYDEGKRAAETLCHDFRRMGGVEVNVARLFNTYGPLMARADGRVMSEFVLAALRGAPLTIFGDGSQTRSFCYVDDMVEMLLRLAARDEPTATNLGNPEEVTVRELAELVIDVVGSTSRIEYAAGRQDEPRQRRPDVGKLTRTLGVVPLTPLRAGVERTVEYFR